MGRIKRKFAKGDRLPPFVPMLWEVLNSRAYRNLPFAASKALPFFLGKCKAPFRDAQRYNIEFSFPYAEAERYGFARATFSRVIAELIAHGFIDPVDRGGLRGAGRSCSVFRLSSRWQRYGEADFQNVDWKSFHPRLSSLVPRQKKMSVQKRTRTSAEMRPSEAKKGGGILRTELVEASFVGCDSIISELSSRSSQGGSRSESSGYAGTNSNFTKSTPRETPPASPSVDIEERRRLLKAQAEQLLAAEQKK